MGSKENAVTSLQQKGMKFGLIFIAVFVAGSALARPQRYKTQQNQLNRLQKISSRLPKINHDDPIKAMEDRMNIFSIEDKINRIEDRMNKQMEDKINRMTRIMNSN